MKDKPAQIKVSFLVIALNAQKTLPRLLDCLKAQTYDHQAIEVILVDSASTDDTRRIMEAFAKENEQKQDFVRVLLLDNPKKYLPCGWNVALGAVQGEAVLRVDAHTTFGEDFIARNVERIEAGEAICSGKVISIPARKTAWSQMLNQAENSMFGGSFAAFRHAEKPCYVTTAAFAMYRKEIFDQVGPYNEALARTEDNEMHYRMRQAGYRFFYDPSIVSYRETRATLRALLRQKYLNGYWIGRTLAVEPRCFSLYHFVPFLFVLAVIFTLLLMLGGISWPAEILWSAYGAANLCMTAAAIVQDRERNGFYVLLPLVFLLLHGSYGVGTLAGLGSLIKSAPGKR